MTHSPKLNIRQRLAAQFLSSGLTVEATAKRVGIDRTTLSKWRKNSAFNDYISALLEQNEHHSAQSLQALKLKAVERLSDLIGSKSHSVALRAIETVLKFAPATPSPAQLAGNAAWHEMQQHLERIQKESQHATPAI